MGGLKPQNQKSLCMPLEQTLGLVASGHSMLGAKLCLRNSGAHDSGG